MKRSWHEKCSALLEIWFLCCQPGEDVEQKIWDAGDLRHFNSLWPSDAICQHWSGSTFACCLMAPSHYLNHCWHHISEILWYSPGKNFQVIAYATILNDGFENDTFKITATLPSDQLVNAYVRQLWCQTWRIRYIPWIYILANRDLFCCMQAISSFFDIICISISLKVVSLTFL